MNGRRAALLAGVAATALGAGVLFAGRLRNRTTGPASGDQSRALTDFQFVDLKGAAASLSAFKGKTVVANFWATWCAPCREEIPALIALGRAFAAKNVLIVGIAVDSRDKVIAFSRDFGIDYPIVIGSAATLDLMRDLGNIQQALPYTVFIDPRGAILDRHLGQLTEASATAKLQRVLGGG